ncbi:DUF2845 domain-containing protein [Andreprevotia chitinilytica]|uniref:DUF2845 domain-containing protein n=1 Tax=Andreprevotia chitinilytica TaxID=396808 RepID=UPI00068D6D1C|nr:DUF2845 domain-containing protein [Andreprevotia chitinilytica]
MSLNHVLLSVLLAAVLPSALADTLRCAGGLVHTGDVKQIARAKCGEPASQDRYEVTDDTQAQRQDASAPRDVVVKDVWVYDFGRDKLGAQLTFVNGKLKQIDTLGYGH